MPIQFFCDACNEKHVVPDYHANRTFRCIKCKGFITVPGQPNLEKSTILAQMAVGVGLAATTGGVAAVVASKPATAIGGMASGAGIVPTSPATGIGGMPSIAAVGGMASGAGIVPTSPATGIGGMPSGVSGMPSGSAIGGMPSGAGIVPTAPASGVGMPSGTGIGGPTSGAGIRQTSGIAPDGEQVIPFGEGEDAAAAALLGGGDAAPPAGPGEINLEDFPASGPSSQAPVSGAGANPAAAFEEPLDMEGIVWEDAPSEAATTPAEGSEEIVVTDDSILWDDEEKK